MTFVEAVPLLQCLEVETVIRPELCRYSCPGLLRVLAVAKAVAAMLIILPYEIFMPVPIYFVKHW